MTITDAPPAVRPVGHRRIVWTALLWLSLVPAAIWLLAHSFGWDAGLWVQLLAFTPYVAIWTLIPALGAFVTRRWAAAAVASLIAFGFAMAVVPRVVADRDGSTPSGVELRVMTSNMLFGGADANQIVRLVRDNRIDVLAVQEFTDPARQALRSAGLEQLLPYHQLAPEPGASGSGLYSRYRFAEQASRRTGGGFQQAHAVVEVTGAGTVYIESVHPLAPASMDMVSGWSGDLGAQLPAEGDQLRILIGDFNATLDHKPLRDLIATGYRDAADAVGKGWIGTWGPYDGDPIPPVTIDHVLADDRIGVKDVQVHNVTDSDHRAVIAWLVIPGGMSDIAIRLISPADAEEMAALLRANREHLAPWDPLRAESYYTAEGQWQVIAESLRAGNALPHAIVENGRIIGRVNLSNLVHGAFQSANLGYWVDASAAGRGVASAAVAAMVEVAFLTHGLHRIEAGTLLHNVRSQRVLERNGFLRFGMAPRYLKIAGAWQDHYLFQLLSENWLAARDSVA